LWEYKSFWRKVGKWVKPLRKIYEKKKMKKTIFSENFEVFGFFLGNSDLKSTSGVVSLGRERNSFVGFIGGFVGELFSNWLLRANLKTLSRKSKKEDFLSKVAFLQRSS
jgi:hypothetical protein